MDMQRTADRSGPWRGRTLAAVLLALLVVPALAGCESQNDTVDFDRADRQKAGRTITLPPDASISIGTGVEGSLDGVVTIPEGHPDAGTYVTNSPAAVQALVDVEHTLGRPGAEASIKVDENGRILSVTSKATKQ